MELIAKNDKTVIVFFQALDRIQDQVEQLTKNCKPSLNGERYFTDRELSEKLKVGRRTLQDYRNEGKIPYFRLGGKVLYKESDIEKMLEKAYCSAWE